MKHFRSASLFLAAAALTCLAVSCAITPEQAKQNEARRQLRVQMNQGAKIVTCDAVPYNAAPGKKYFLVMDPNASDLYRENCASALNKTLKHEGFTAAPDAKSADFILDCSYGTDKGHLMKTWMTLSAHAQDPAKLYWKGNFSCLSKPRDCGRYLPGLAVAGTSNMGKLFTGNLNVVKYHREALEAVYEQYPSETKEK